MDSEQTAPAESSPDERASGDGPSGEWDRGEGGPDEVAPGIWRVRIPLHVRVDPVNAYMLLDDDGSVTVFDTGVAPGASRLWKAALAAVDRSPQDVQRFVVSHHHPDHIGGSGPLHALTGAVPLASSSTIHQAPDVWGDRGRIDEYIAAVDAHLREHGLPDEVARALEHETELARIAITLPPDDAWQPLDDGDRIEAAGRSWHVVATPGHADGQIVLHDRDGGLLLAADHLLERISPAVGRFPRHERDPLARYLESLMKVAMLDPKLVLPGHGDPFAGGADRARVLVSHHQQRIDQCVEAVREIGNATAYDTARLVFAHVFEREQLDAPNQRFATTETLAHLERARAEGRVTRARDDEGRVRYETAAEFDITRDGA
ncbi:MAG: MBL fold metallo-hydrolase [Thermoleophilia bacterium]|nr:MBL fold metallo-hydrolase [Thermoleophilia bacterium]